jgi:Rod binding domain-containing protein
MSGMSTIPAAHVSASAMLPTTTTDELTRGRKAAREFEAQLIGNVLQSFEKTFATLPGEDSMAGEDDYDYMGTQALATAIAAGGGFGIAEMISAHLAHESRGGSPGSHQPLPSASP